MRTPLDKYRVREALVTLTSLSIVFYDSEGETFSLHPLVHEWVNYRISRREKSTWACIAFNIWTDSLRLPGGGTQDRKDAMSELSGIIATSSPIQTLVSNRQIRGSRRPGH
jgi:hypothetical protein